MLPFATVYIQVDYTTTNICPRKREKGFVSFLEASDIILEDDVTDSVRGVKGIHAVLFCKWQFETGTS